MPKDQLEEILAKHKSIYKEMLDLSAKKSVIGAFKRGIQIDEYRNEIAFLNQLLQYTRKILITEFTEHCRARNRTFMQPYGLSLIDRWDDPSNCLDLDFANQLFGLGQEFSIPKEKFLELFAPDASSFIECVISHPLAEPILHIKAIDESQLSHAMLTNLIIDGRYLFCVSQLNELTLAQHSQFKQKLFAQAPGLASKLYQRNASLIKLAQDIAFFESNGKSVREALIQLQDYLKHLLPDYPYSDIKKDKSKEAVTYFIQFINALPEQEYKQILEYETANGYSLKFIIDELNKYSLPHTVIISKIDKLLDDLTTCHLQLVNYLYKRPNHATYAFLQDDSIKKLFYMTSKAAAVEIYLSDPDKFLGFVDTLSTDYTTNFYISQEKMNEMIVSSGGTPFNPDQEKILFYRVYNSAHAFHYVYAEPNSSRFSNKADHFTPITLRASFLIARLHANKLKDYELGALLRRFSLESYATILEYSQFKRYNTGISGALTHLGEVLSFFTSGQLDKLKIHLIPEMLLKRFELTKNVAIIMAFNKIQFLQQLLNFYIDGYTVDISFLKQDNTFAKVLELSLPHIEMVFNFLDKRSLHSFIEDVVLNIASLCRDNKLILLWPKYESLFNIMLDRPRELAIGLKKITTEKSLHFIFQKIDDPLLHKICHSIDAQGNTIFHQSNITLLKILQTRLSTSEFKNGLMQENYSGEIAIFFILKNIRALELIYPALSEDWPTIFIKINIKGRNIIHEAVRSYSIEFFLNKASLFKKSLAKALTKKDYKNRTPFDYYFLYRLHQQTLNTSLLINKMAELVSPKHLLAIFSRIDANGQTLSHYYDTLPKQVMEKINSAEAEKKSNYSPRLWQQEKLAKIEVRAGILEKRIV
ncbi:TPA: hypothetical protein RJD83_002644 [Legionella pneumophila]|nr:hypothetical protein [Legionella pneumophila]